MRWQPQVMTKMQQYLHFQFELQSSITVTSTLLIQSLSDGSEP
jgi:hypothetical protein